MTLTSVTLSHLTYDTNFSRRNKVGNGLHLVAVGYLLVYLDDGIFKREVTRSNESEGVADVTEHLLVAIFNHALHDVTVDATVAGGIATEHAVRHDILLYTATTLEERHAAYTYTILHNTGTGQNGPVVELTLGSDAHADSHNTVGTDLDIVTDMHLAHQ